MLMQLFGTLYISASHVANNVKRPNTDLQQERRTKTVPFTHMDQWPNV